MSSLSPTIIYIIQTLGSLYITIITLRFLLQLARADFYNPISQFVVRITSPLLIPIRKIIPGYRNIDIASIALAIIIQIILMSLTLLIYGYEPISQLLYLFIWSFISILAKIKTILFFILLINVILSWVAPNSLNPGAQLVNQIGEMFLAPFRTIIPNLGGIDISPIFAFITLQVFDMLIIQNLIQATGFLNIFTPFL